MFSCFFDYDYQIDEKKPLIKKEPQILRSITIEQNTQNIIKEPEYNPEVLYIIQEKLNLNINDEIFLGYYIWYAIDYQKHLYTEKERILNFLNVFRVFYKKILMDKYVKLSTLKVLQDRYIYFCESSVKYKEIILESYLDEIREILIQVQKLPFGNN